MTIVVRRWERQLTDRTQSLVDGKKRKFNGFYAAHVLLTKLDIAHQSWYCLIRERIGDVGAFRADFEHLWTPGMLKVLTSLSWSGFVVQKTFGVEWSVATVTVRELGFIVPPSTPNRGVNVFIPYSCLTGESSFDLMPDYGPID